MLTTRDLKIQSGARITEHRIEVSFRGGGAAGQARMMMDGVAEEVDWAEVEPGVYSFLAGNRSITVSVRKEPASSSPSSLLPAIRNGGRYQVSTGGRTFQIEARDSQARRLASKATAHEGPLEILAPMPGRIAKLLAQENAMVAKGDGLLVIEAMKMQNEIRAPRAGRVGKVSVREGEGVEMGARLMRVE
ncbi:MAG: acetyl-CoA carboxylase biotin carboxyl carrier protein subunit [Terriglobia bacterium]